MKRLLVVAALLSTACGSQGPTDSSPPPGSVTLGTFTGEVDLVAGTFSVRADREAVQSRPDPRGDPRGVQHGDHRQLGLGLEQRRPGRAMRRRGGHRSQRHRDPAVSDAHLPGRGLRGDHLRERHRGERLQQRRGAERDRRERPVRALVHGSLAWTTAGGATTSATTEWNFTTASATRFTFSGRIVAMVGTQLSGLVRTAGPLATSRTRERGWSTHRMHRMA